MTTPFDQLPRIEAGTPMPSGAKIIAGDRKTRLAAELGSANLLTAIRRYFTKASR